MNLQHENDVERLRQAALLLEAENQRLVAKVFELTRQLAKQGVFVGISSGANLAGALRVARTLPAGTGVTSVVVVIFCDGGEKYLSERFWDEKEPG